LTFFYCAMLCKRGFSRHAVSVCPSVCLSRSYILSKRISIYSNFFHSQHVPIYLQQFLSYSNRKCKKSPFSRTAAHVFVSPGDAPGAITLNVVCMERQLDAYKLSRSMYPSIFNSFPFIRTASSKNRHFHVPQPTFLFPLETPLRLSRNVFHGWKDNSMLVKPLAACTYLHLQ